MSSAAADAAFMAEEQKLLAAIKQSGENTLTIYGSNFTDPLGNPATNKAFSARYPGMTIKGVQLSLYDIGPRITAERNAGTDSLDLIMAGGFGILPVNDWVMPYESPLHYAPHPAWWERVFPGQIYIVGPYVDVAFAWNTNIIKDSDIDFTKDWLAPMDPKFKSQLGIATPAKYGYNSAWFVNMRAVLGDATWQQYMVYMAQNARQYQSGVINNVVSGDVGIAVAVGSVATILNNIDSGAPVKYYISKHTYNSPIKLGIYQKTKNPNLAKLFLNWCLWRQGYQAIVGGAPWRNDSIYPDVNTKEYQQILSGRTITEDPSPDYPTQEGVYNQYAIAMFNNQQYSATPPPMPTIPAGGYPSYTGP